MMNTCSNLSINNSAKIITDVKQMHNRPSRRCYVYSINNEPIYQLDYMKSTWEDNHRWYGWIGMTTRSSVASIINPFFPMSDTAKGAIRSELGKEKPSGVYGVPSWPVIIYEFKNFEQATRYFPALPLHIEYINHKNKLTQDGQVV